MIKATIKSSKGNLLTGNEITILSVILRENGNIIPLDEYGIRWFKVKNGRYLDESDSKTIQVSAADIDSVAKYECRVCRLDALTDKSGNRLTDAQDNQLVAYTTLYSSSQELFKSNETPENFPVNPDDYTIILATRSLKLLGQIVNIDYDSVTAKCNLNSADQLNFTIYKELDDTIEPLWDKIIDLKLVYVIELGEFFEINVQVDDTSDKITKTISANSLAESELSQIKLNDIEINTENDIARDDYVVTKFYDPVNPKGSFLHRILEKAPNYTIGHVDETLYTLQRSFSVDDTSIYDFLTGDCAEQFNCLFQFDSKTRTINVYDLYANCLNPQCGNRGEFSDVCPVCGGTALSYFGEDTTIYVDKDNLTDSITFTTDVDSVKNCFKIVGGDDNVTAAIRSVIPSGSDYIYYLSDEQKEDMSDELQKKYAQYVKACEDAEDNYMTINENIYEALDKILYYTSGMMPDIKNEESTAKDEAAKLTSANLSPVGLSSVTASTSVSTVNAALKNYAKVYVKSGYFKIEIDTSTEGANSFEYVGTDDDGYNYGTWYGRFIITNYSDEEDVAKSDFLTLKVYDDYGTFLDQKIKKNIVKDDDQDGNVYNVLAIKDLNKFKEALTLYGLNRLTSFHDAVQGVIDILVEDDQASEGADWYNDIYLPYYNKLQACETEMDARQRTIDEWQTKHDNYVKQRTAIQNSLDMKTYFGEDLYNEFNLYRREDIYSNDNFISDGLDNAELLEKAKELVEDAKTELFKSGERQHTISSTLNNLLVMPEFAPLVDHFQLGNWIRVNVDGNIYRLRLISYEINFGSLQTINVEFSDITKTSVGYTDISSIKKQTQSLAGSYSYISKQAKQGEEANNSIGKMLKDGLDASVMSIKSADTEDVIIGKNGIRLRAWDDIYNAYSPKQAALIHNKLVYTDDNWKTARSALGEINYTIGGQKYNTYGLISDAVISGLILAGQIYSANYSDEKGKEAGTHIDLETGSFSLAGERIKYTAGGNRLTLKDVLVEYTTEEGKDERTDLDKIITGQQTTAIIVDQIKSNYISTDNFYAKFAEIDLAEIKELYADSAFIKSLNAEYATIEYLEANYIDATTINTDYLKTANLVANIAKINLADIETLQIRNGFIDSLQTITQTTIASTVDTEMVKDLIAGHITVNELFTSNFTIGSDDNGTTVMNGSTMQFKDANGKVYIQLGTDAEGGHSFIVNDSNGTALINGSGITPNAVADSLIVDRMVKKKDTSYNGISGDKLNIDSVVTAINGASTSIKSSQIYFDEDNQSLNTKLVNMQNQFSKDLTDRIAENETYQARIDTSNGKVLGTANSTTLTCILQKGKEVIDASGTMFRYVWRRKSDVSGKYDTSYIKVGKSVTVSYNDIPEDYIYICDVEDVYGVTDKSGNLLTDASGNELTAYYPIIRADITIAKNIEEILTTKYYTKEETPNAVTTILGQTDISKYDGQTNSIIDVINTTKDTVGSHAESISKMNTSLTEMSTWQSNFEQSYDGFKSEVSKTYTTKTEANGAIASVTVMYYKSTSATSLTGGTWKANEIPQWTNGTYIWTKTVTTTKGGSTSESTPVCISGAKGDTGNPGINGKGIKSVVPQYYISTSSITQSGGAWSNNEPTAISGGYIWTRSLITWDDNTQTTTTPALATALNTALSKDGVNLLRNSETLIFDDNIIGNELSNASGYLLTDASGNILVA